MKLKKVAFDIDKALAGAQVITRSGDPVKIVHYEPKMRNRFNVAGIIDGVGYRTWTSKGTFGLGSLGEHDRDLFLLEEVKEPIKVEFWSNVYKRNSDGEIMVCGRWKSKDLAELWCAAESLKDHTHLGAIKLSGKIKV